MPIKHPRHDSDIEQFAKDLAGRWQQGDGIEPWLRIMEPEFSRKVRTERWSWESIARALNLAGITYQTAHPWTGVRLIQKITSIRHEGRKRAPKKGTGTQRVSTWESPFAGANASASIPVEDEVPEFKPITLLNWSGKLITEEEEKPPKKEPVPGPKIDVDAVIRRLLGKE